MLALCCALTGTWDTFVPINCKRQTPVALVAATGRYDRYHEPWAVQAPVESWPCKALSQGMLMATVGGRLARTL